jgi:cytochrome P450
MINLFSVETRRNPYPLYDQMRSGSPVFKAPPPFDMWMIFDFDGVKQVVSDHETFSSAVPAPDVAKCLKLGRLYRGGAETRSDD